VRFLEALHNQSRAVEDVRLAPRAKPLHPAITKLMAGGRIPIWARLPLART